MQRFAPQDYSYRPYELLAGYFRRIVQDYRAWDTLSSGEKRDVLFNLTRWYKFRDELATAETKFDIFSKRGLLSDDRLREIWNKGDMFVADTLCAYAKIEARPITPERLRELETFARELAAIEVKSPEIKY